MATEKRSPGRPPKPPWRMLSLKVDEALYRRAQALAAREDETLTALVERALLREARRLERRGA